MSEEDIPFRIRPRREGTQIGSLSSESVVPSLTPDPLSNRLTETGRDSGQPGLPQESSNQAGAVKVPVRSPVLQSRISQTRIGADEAERDAAIPPLVLSPAGEWRLIKEPLP